MTNELSKELTLDLVGLENIDFSNDDNFKKLLDIKINKRTKLSLSKYCNIGILYTKEQAIEQINYVLRYDTELPRVRILKKKILETFKQNKKE